MDGLLSYIFTLEVVQPGYVFERGYNELGFEIGGLTDE